MEVAIPCMNSTTFNESQCEDACYKSYSTAERRCFFTLSLLLHSTCVFFKMMARFHLLYEWMTASSSFLSFYYSFGKRAKIEYDDSRLDTPLSVDYRYCYEWICFKNSSNNHQICLYMNKQRNRNARPEKNSDAVHYYFSIRAIFETFSNSLASEAFWRLWWYKYLLR